MKSLFRFSLAAAFVAAPLAFASAQSLPGAGLLGQAQAVGGNSALSGAARDMAVKEATGSIKQKAGDYAKQKALDTAAKNPKLAGHAAGASSKLDAAKKLRGMKVGDAKSMAMDHGKAKARDAATGAVTKALGN